MNGIRALFKAILQACVTCQATDRATAHHLQRLLHTTGLLDSDCRPAHNVLCKAWHMHGANHTSDPVSFGVPSVDEFKLFVPDGPKASSDTPPPSP